MSLIFDGFPDRASAGWFCLAARVRWGLESQVYGDDATAQHHDPFPCQLEPWIVHVDRREDEHYIDDLRTLAETFGGRRLRR